MPATRRWLWLLVLLLLIVGGNEALRAWWRLDLLDRLLAVLLALTLWAFINGRWIFAHYHALRSAWLSRRLPEARPLRAGERLLVLAPHPDDEVLAAAGQIQRALAAGAAVRIIWLTLGDGFDLASGRPAPRPEALRELALRRMEEARRAAGILGVPPEEQVFLGYPDQGLLRLFLTHYYLPYTSPHTDLEQVAYPGCRTPGAPYTGQALEADLEAEVRGFAPTRVLVPSPLDAHPDHQATAYFAMRILGKLGEEEKLRYYIVHGGYEYPLPKGLHPRLPLYPAPRGRRLPWRRVDLGEAEVARKLEATRAHASQMRLIGNFMLAFVRTCELLSPLPIPVRTLPEDLELD
ncbi:PIG-L deacetylase family protein [Oceanithermus sp.]